MRKRFAPSTIYLKCGLPSLSMSDATFEMFTASGLGTSKGKRKKKERKIISGLYANGDTTQKVPCLPSTTRHEQIRLEAEMRIVTEIRPIHNDLARYRRVSNFQVPNSNTNFVVDAKSNYQTETDSGTIRIPSSKKKKKYRIRI